MSVIDHCYSETGDEQIYWISMTGKEREGDALCTPVTAMKTKLKSKSKSKTKLES